MAKAKKDPAKAAKAKAANDRTGLARSTAGSNPEVEVVIEPAAQVQFDNLAMTTIAAPIEMIIDRKKYIAIPAEDYEELVRNAPKLPPADARGNRDAVKFAEASIARNIIRRREAAGWTQKQLAERAGIRVEVLNRAERGTVVPSVRTLTKIEVALRKAGH